MQQVNLHKQRLIALIIAAVALISIFLPWTVQKVAQQFLDFFNQGGGGGGRSTMNGFRNTGLLSFLGIAGVAVASLMGDKMKEYDKNTKMIAMVSFGVISLGALIYLLQLSSRTNKALGASAGIGLWIALIVGLAGVAWVSGILNQMTQSKPSAGTTPPAPPPPASK